MTVDNAEHQLRMEIDENENRQGFSFSEKMEWARRLERLERLAAEERMKEGVNQHSPTENFPYPSIRIEYGQGKFSCTASQNSDTPRGRTDDTVAKDTGFGSRDTYNKAKQKR